MNAAETQLKMPAADSQRSLEQTRWVRAIERHFRGIPGRLDARLLWSRGNRHYFRVNWWRWSSERFERCIGHSAFVVVTETRDGLVVQDRTRDQAA